MSQLVNVLSPTEIVEIGLGIDDRLPQTGKDEIFPNCSASDRSIQEAFEKHLLSHHLIVLKR